jgi:hypothetical protein
VAKIECATPYFQEKFASCNDVFLDFLQAWILEFLSVFCYLFSVLFLNVFQPPQLTLREGKLMNRVATIFIAVTALLCGVAVQAATPDVAGITVGITITNAKTLLSKINPSYKITELKSTKGKILGLKASARGQPQNGADQMVVMTNDAGFVWFVARQQDYDKGQFIAQEAFEKALIEKYGEPTTSQFDGIISKRWEIERNGKTHTDQRSLGPCTAEDGTHSSYDNVPGTKISVPTDFRPKCGMLITATASPDIANPTLVAGLITEVTDSQRKYDELSTRAATVEADRQKQLQQARERMTVNKPKR